ncbi:MAG TPA: pentapeptide repeat-containing protein [Dermatophilaceae bacterium]|nr:pentapeptide repeat-containing protein [Dermatophilaceae bacterium]
MNTERAPERRGAAALPLTADCVQCDAFCCVALPLTVSADFAIDKPAGQPCPHVSSDGRCGIHANLVARGFPGCRAYDCFGAGQQLTRAIRTAARPSWRDDPAGAPQLFAAFDVLRQLHEMLVYLVDALTRSVSPVVWGRAGDLADRIGELARRPPAGLAGVDIPAERVAVGAVLREVSASVRAADPPGADVPRTLRRSRGSGAAADWSGRHLSGADLRGADLAGAVLIGADLRGADLSRTDLRGADLRAADLRGVDLREALYLTVAQLGSARTDDATRLPTLMLVAPDPLR